ncbi:argininosuccinate lyase [Buchnera aphidicola]|uniref:Argininosuccinate lyase n=1 Tax=Buchnera aphidicola subsp. Tuberolachnus salignus TaxID=98804 RepID=A0A160SWN4_BUCTT|nr:argininosuccinate lyase [Buchnera aphidicola]CUR53018.1 Argininosuccinate lyase [Buchnera aphidicola (Tuberolachnus salignus)]
MNLWGGRFTKKSHQKFEKFNNSFEIDYRLFHEDIFSSIAWSKILCDVQVLTIQEQKIIETGLYDVEKEFINIKKKNIFNSEDVHSWIEKKLIEKIGILGKKLHTGRSRNDQIATDLKLWCKTKIKILFKKIVKLQTSFLNVAELYQNVIFPGYTHLQRAQPITFSYWCLAYFEMLERDYIKLKHALSNLDYSPLGSGAISGTSWEIDRHKLAQFMSFKTCTNNALDSVSDRDFIIELLSVSSISMMHLSRFSEDFIFYNTNEANFIELEDNITSGSSLLPQKKNPDILELIRGRCSTVYGCLFSVCTLLKGLPLSYNKDLQEEKRHLFLSLDMWESCLDISSLVLKNFKINVQKCQIAVQEGYSNSTELVDYLVQKNVPFREAHHIVGQIIIYAIQKKQPIENLELKELQKYHKKIDQTVYKVLTLKSCLNKKNSFGGSSLKRIEESLKNAKILLLNK